MRVQLADSDQPQALSAAVRFGGLGRRYILIVFDDRPVGLRSHADGSGLFPEARSKLIALSGRDLPRLDAGHRLQLGPESDGKNNRRASSRVLRAVGEFVDPG